MKLTLSRRQWLLSLAGFAVIYLALAYFLLPALWKHHEHEPGLAALPMVTRTGTGIPGDALNVGLVGSQEDVLRAMQAAGWFPADPVTLALQHRRSSAAWCWTGPITMRRSARSIIEGKKEQLAFEKPDGRSADRRHHVRFWLVLEKGADGRPVWLGAVTYDRGVGPQPLTPARSPIISGPTSMPSATC